MGSGELKGDEHVKEPLRELLRRKAKELRSVGLNPKFVVLDPTVYEGLCFIEGKGELKEFDGLEIVVDPSRDGTTSLVLPSGPEMYRYILAELKKNSKLVTIR